MRLLKLLKAFIVDYGNHDGGDVGLDIADTSKTVRYVFSDRCFNEMHRIEVNGETAIQISVLGDESGIEITVNSKGASGISVLPVASNVVRIKVREL